MHGLILPSATIPLWILVILYAASVLFFMGYLGSLWEPFARPFLRTSAASGAFWGALALLLMAHSAANAQYWYRWYLPLLGLMEVGLLDSTLTIIGARRPPIITTLWALMGIFLVTSVVVLPYPTLRPVPDGYYLAVVSLPMWLAVAKLTLYAAFPCGITALIVRRLRLKHPRRFRWYAVFGLGTVPLMIHDAFLVHHMVTPYPTSWVVGCLWGTILWFELRAQIQSAHRHISYDSLTGSQSRSYGEWYLDHALKKGPVAVVFVDADRFKAINDRWGHAAGDEALRRLGRALRSALDGEGVVVRMGGDEFLCIIPGAESFQKSLWLRRLVDKFQAQTSPQLNAPPLSASLGWGWAGIGGNRSALLDRADRAMYRDKAQRRQYQDESPISSRPLE